MHLQYPNWFRLDSFPWSTSFKLVRFVNYSRLRKRAAQQVQQTVRKLTAGTYSARRDGSDFG